MSEQEELERARLHFEDNLANVARIANLGRQLAEAQRKEDARWNLLFTHHQGEGACPDPTDACWGCSLREAQGKLEWDRWLVAMLVATEYTQHAEGCPREWDKECECWMAQVFTAAEARAAIDVPPEDRPSGLRCPDCAPPPDALKREKEKNNQ